MLDTLRAHSRSVLTYVLFGIIIIVFVVSFGPGSKGCEGGGRTEAWAAKVNGAAVTPSEFDQQYSQLLRVYRQQGGEVNGLFQMRLRQMAMDQVIQRELVQQEAQKQGIVVTDEEVASAIKALPGFQSNDRFDMELYKRAVSNAYGSPAKFEELMRRDLGYQKMMSLLRETARVTGDEVKEAWLADSDRATLEFARFPLALARVDVKAQSSSGWEAQVKDFIARSGARIEQYYKENPARFDKKKRVRARHILVKVDEKAGAPEQDAAKKKIEAIADRIKKGEDFARVATETSDDPGSKGRGGDLGFFGAGMMAKAFEDAAFKLKPGELSGPVKTQFGWHLIKVEEVQEPEKVPLEKAQPDIARELLETDLAKKLATQKADEALKRLQSGKSFAEVFPVEEAKGEKKGAEPVKMGGQIVKPDETGSFTASSSPNVPRIGPAPDLFADAMNAAAGQVLPRVYETTSGPVVARAKVRERPDQAKFSEMKSGVETRLRLRRESEIERAWVEELRKRSKVEANKAFVQGEVRAAPVELD
jgi:peptidyl-prolyl cis-trans isomerase D